MIAVIADDFTGAAELGGIGLRYGLSVEISTVVKEAAELLVIDADSRSVDEATAVRKIEHITAELMKLEPEWIYKKADSVLRGHVVAELKAQMKGMGTESALLVPANPYLGRTIQDGIYYFNNQPIHESSFSIDPEFAITSSQVQDMLKEKVYIAKRTTTLPTGIVVGEAVQMNDLDFWAEACSKNILPAGAAGFFTALLENRTGKKSVEMPTYKQSPPVLYVLGTTFKKKSLNGPVSYLPANNIKDLLRTHEKAIIAIDPETKEKNAVWLREEMARIVENALKENTIGEMIIEGGSTARAIFNRLGYEQFYPVQEISPGMVRMKLKGHEIFITVKPGSYAWPEGTI